MAIQYEYSLIHTQMEFQMTPLEYEALGEQEKGIAFARPLGQVTSQITNAIAALPEGNWEAVSHDLMPFGASLIITILIRHPR